MNKMPGKSRILEFLTVERERLAGYVRRYIDDTAERDSEDIVQDVILNIFNRADITIPIENVAAYVYQALRNKVIDYLRKRRSTISLDERSGDNEENLFLDLVPDPSTDGINELSRMEARESVFSVLAMLNDEERSVLIATELEGKTFHEISDESGIAIGTLLARKSRAIKKIKQSFSINK
jgi:RNA polymerase sigma-70 factor (ECF subfamily)